MTEYEQDLLYQKYCRELKISTWDEYYWAYGNMKKAGKGSYNPWSATLSQQFAYYDARCKTVQDWENEHPEYRNLYRRWCRWWLGPA